MNDQWWKRAVFYQIYPRSFLDSNGDGIGDIGGIIDRLDYLADLGVNALWLCPVYRSPNDDNGYDISDYRDVNPEFGTMADVEALLRAAHSRGLRVIMDLVVNHTSDEHPWFVASRSSRDNPYRDYYIWRDGKDGKAPNNWASRFSGSAWEQDDATGQYYLHLFSKKQPDLNWENPKVREEVHSLMRFWMEKGFDGFRMDVINMISKAPGLPNDTVSTATIGAPFYANGPRVHEYIAEMRRAVMPIGGDERDGGVTVGETKGVSTATALLYAGAERKELDMVFQFEFDLIDAGPGGKWDIRPWKLADFKRIMTRWQVELHGKAWNSLFLENHDMPRSVSRFGDDGEYRGRSAKLLAFFLLTMEGTPFIYQGQELGMTNPRFPGIEDYRDIQTLNMYRDYTEKRGVAKDAVLAKLHYKSRDNARTPMQWTAEPGAGFSTGTPWISVNPNHATINAASQLGDDDSVLNCYRSLIALRAKTDVLLYGNFTEYFSENEQVYAYARRYNDDAAYILLNFSASPAPAPALFPEALPQSELQLVMSNVAAETAEPEILQPYEARLHLSGKDRKHV